MLPIHKVVADLIIRYIAFLKKRHVCYHVLKTNTYTLELKGLYCVFFLKYITLSRCDTELKVDTWIGEIVVHKPFIYI